MSAVPLHQYTYDEKEIYFSKLKKLSLFCSICELPCCSTVKLNCNHRYCNECLKRYEEEMKEKEKERRCFICNQEIGTYYDDKDSEELFHELEVYCKMRKNGCTWKGMRREYATHESEECSYYKCKNSALGCQWIGRSKDEDAHLLFCDFIIISCAYAEFGCKFTAIKKLINDHERNNCDKKKYALFQQRKQKKNRDHDNDNDDDDEKRRKREIEINKRKEKYRKKLNSFIYSTQFVDLNISGKLFRVPKQLLTSQPSLLSILISEEPNFQPADDISQSPSPSSSPSPSPSSSPACYYFDCDEEGFRLLLFWLRSSYLPNNLSNREVAELIQVAKTFEVEALLIYLSLSPQYRSQYLAFFEPRKSLLQTLLSHDELLIDNDNDDDDERFQDFHEDDKYESSSSSSDSDGDDDDDDSHHQHVLNDKLSSHRLNIDIIHCRKKKKKNIISNADHAVVADYHHDNDQKKKIQILNDDDDDRRYEGDHQRKHEIIKNEEKKEEMNEYKYDDTYYRTKVNSRNQNLYSELSKLRKLGDGKIYIPHTNFKDEWIAGFDFRKSLIDHSSFISCFLSAVCMKEVHAHYTSFKRSYIVDSDFSNANLVHTRFNRCNLANSNFSSIHASHLHFQTVNLRNTNFSKSTIHHLSISFSSILDFVSFSFSSLSYIDLSNRDLSSLHFKKCKLSFIDFSNSDLSSVDFSECIIDDVKFVNCNLEKSKFVKIKAAKTDFTNANLQSTDFSNSDLQFISFPITDNKPMMGIHFVNTKLKNIDFSNSDLSSVDFSECSIDEVKFVNCNLEKSKFVKIKAANTDFTNANLKETDFRNAELVDVNFNSAIVHRINFSSSNISMIDYEEITSFNRCIFNRALFKHISPSARFISCQFTSNALNDQLTITADQFTYSTFIFSDYQPLNKYSNLQLRSVLQNSHRIFQSAIDNKKLDVTINGELNCSFRNCDLTLNSGIYENLHFTDCRLYYYNVSCEFKNCEFKKCKISGIMSSSTKFTIGNKFIDCDMRGVDGSEYDMFSILVQLHRHKMAGVDGSECDMKLVVFENCNFDGMKINPNQFPIHSALSLQSSACFKCKKLNSNYSIIRPNNNKNDNNNDKSWILLCPSCSRYY